jgi:hypothetical protein
MHRPKIVGTSIGCAHRRRRSPLKIKRESDGKTTIIWLVGRIRSEDLDELKSQMDDNSERMILDLNEVTLVDADVIRFLSTRERKGVRLVHYPPYVSGFEANEWKEEFRKRYENQFQERSVKQTASEQWCPCN